MNDSAFDPTLFLDATTTEANTRRPALPAGTVLQGQITDITPRAWQGKADPSKSGVALDVKIQCQVPPDLQAQGQPPELTFTDGIMLDQREGGGIDMAPGKNGKLRRYRDSTDTNVPGVAFSPRMLIGKFVKVKTKVEPYEGELYDRVDSVAHV